MTVTEARVRPIFAEIKSHELSANPDLARVVLAVVQDACKHSKGRFTVRDVAEQLRDGKMFLYGVLDTQSAKLEATVVAKPQDGLFEIISIGPDFEDVAPFMVRLEKYARDHGCTRMSLTGPQFFKRSLPDGWFAREVRYERKLDGAG